MPFDTRFPHTDWAARDEAIRQERAEIQEICARDRLPLPWGPYEAAPLSCFRCGTRIVVYTWLGHRPRSGERPPAPRPRTLGERTTRMSGGETYWANTCARCGATQGDHFLYEDQGAPFRKARHQPRRMEPAFEQAIEDPFESPEEAAAKIRGLVNFMQEARLGRR